MKFKILKIKKNEIGFKVLYEYKGEQFTTSMAYYENPEIIIDLIRSEIKYRELLKKPLPKSIKQLEGRIIQIKEATE